MESKKIGTLSLNINTVDFNYGAILHSWAFQKYLEKNNLCEKVDIINYTSPKFEMYSRKNQWKDIFKSNNFKSIILKVLTYPFTNKAYKSRYAKFEEFIKNNMTTTDKHYNQETLKNASFDYDTVICESDVIWSASYFGGKFDPSFFLDSKSFNNMKKIAYAPSMADGDLSNEQEKEMKELLRNLDYISCRESYEKEILEKLTDKNVEQVLDPVFLLDKDDYNEIIGKRPIADEYLLLYLPVNNNNNKLRNEAKKYAKKNNLKIVEISTKCLKTPVTKTLTDSSVEDFLAAIKYANTIFTNSFHGVCFSLIFEKQFYAFSRKSNGKVKDICCAMNLFDRFLSNDVFVELPEINYKQINFILKEKIKESKKWINDALKGNNQSAENEEDFLNAR